MRFWAICYPLEVLCSVSCSKEIFKMNTRYIPSIEPPLSYSRFDSKTQFNKSLNVASKPSTLSIARLEPTQPYPGIMYMSNYEDKCYAVKSYWTWTYVADVSGTEKDRIHGIVYTVQFNICISYYLCIFWINLDLSFQLWPFYVCFKIRHDTYLCKFFHIKK